MANVYKRLGAVSSSASTEVDVYNTPAATTAIISTITIANRGSTQATFRLAMAAEGDGTAAKDYIAYDTPIAGNDVIAMTMGLTMAPDWDLRVWASNSSLSVQAWGVEQS